MIIIDLIGSKRSYYSAFVIPGEEDVSGIKQTSGVVAKSAQLGASLETMKENNSTLVTEQAEAEVLLENEKWEYDSFSSANALLFARVDELAGEVQNLTENATELHTNNVELMALVAVFESFVIRNDQKQTLDTGKLRLMYTTYEVREREMAETRQSQEEAREASMMVQNTGGGFRS